MERLVQFTVWWIVVIIMCLSAAYMMILWGQGHRDEALATAVIALYVRMILTEMNQ
jgi:hypothetical protein